MESKEVIIGHFPKGTIDALRALKLYADDSTETLREAINAITFLSGKAGEVLSKTNCHPSLLEIIKEKGLEFNVKGKLHCHLPNGTIRALKDLGMYKDTKLDSEALRGTVNNITKLNGSGSEMLFVSECSQELLDLLKNVLGEGQ
jgi:hypothetical protein